MCRTMFREDIAGRMIAPGKQSRLQFQLRLGCARTEDHMIRSAVFETLRRIHLEIAAEIAKPEVGGVEQVRAQIR